MARHDVVDGLRLRAQARRLVVQRQADRIQQRGFACPRRAGDRKQAALGQRRHGEVDAPFALERVEILQLKTANFHGLAPTSLPTASTICA
ncbi:hypothetical protein SDC9_95900 [bioreactor metagenome]|uniref:Uncharacterized protein n=1 Tax=bioreactor metagenome TaxID=1076179 RepID=A0A645A7S9_9ZZZZ